MHWYLILRLIFEAKVAYFIRNWQDIKPKVCKIVVVMVTGRESNANRWFLMRNMFYFAKACEYSLMYALLRFLLSEHSEHSEHFNLAEFARVGF